MEKGFNLKTLVQEKTRLAFLWTRILDTPFWAMFNMLPFILYKDLQASSFEIAVIIALKPLSAIISMYWSDHLSKKGWSLKNNILLSNLIRHLPFFLFPWVSNPWFFIFAFGLNMALYRGAQPAWMEILKVNLPGVAKEKTFAFGSALGYIGDAIIPFVIGMALDGVEQGWRYIFPITALISLFPLVFQWHIPLKEDLELKANPIKSSLKDHVVSPWKSTFQLIKKRRDFAYFQIGFILGGSGLIIMQPALPAFFFDSLKLSYTELAVALTFCKGIGFALSTPFWTRFIGREDIFRFTSHVIAIAALFPFFLLFAKFNLIWLYLGYIGYGIMQAGSNLSWNMSGPIFSKDEDSSLFTTVNVVTVGLRGLVAPALGSILNSYFGSQAPLIGGALLCLLATERLFSYSRKLGFSKREA